jgi:hypothetical protein
MRIAIVGLVTCLSGCFGYRQLRTATPARGVEIATSVTAPLEVRIGDITVHDVTFAQGRVAYADGDSIVISGTRFVSVGGMEYGSLGSRLTIPRGEVLELRERRVSTWKTALALGAGGAAIAAIVASVGPLSGSSSGGGPGKPPASVRAP